MVVPRSTTALQSGSGQDTCRALAGRCFSLNDLRASVGENHHYTQNPSLGGLSEGQ